VILDIAPRRESEIVKSAADAVTVLSTVSILNYNHRRESGIKIDLPSKGWHLKYTPVYSVSLRSGRFKSRFVN
jgi:hypothetical protein